MSEAEPIDEHGYANSQALFGGSMRVVATDSGRNGIVSDEAAARRAASE